MFQLGDPFGRAQFIIEIITQGAKLTQPQNGPALDAIGQLIQIDSVVECDPAYQLRVLTPEEVVAVAGGPIIQNGGS